MARSERFVHGVAPDVENREQDDFYPTPVEATKSLLALEQFGAQIWEPACGDGAISRVLEEAGYFVHSADLVDRGYGDARVDFLLEHRLRAPQIITNPPFKLAEQFVDKCVTLGVEKWAFLLRLAWLEGVGRKHLFTHTPLARVLVSSRRLTMVRAGDEDLRGNGGMVAFAWFVWDQGCELRHPPTLRFFDWMDHAPECAREKAKTPPEPMSLFAE